jgi:anti-repressor protein
MQVNELITVSTNERQQPVISGRELHEFLGVGTAYKDWFPRMCEYGFTDGVDFCSNLSESTGGRPATDHALTLDMAKELAMLQRTERGKQARQYFLQVEKDFNSPEKVMARALKIADEELRTVKAQLQIAAPKAEGYDTLMSSGDCISIGEMAKLLKTGQNRLFRFLRGLRILMSDNIPYQEHIDAGRFRVIEQSWKFDGAAHIGFKTLVTPKGQDYIRKVWEPLKIGERDARDRA